MKARDGFTLIETLIVMALITILAAMLFPVFAQAREKVRQTTCASNLRQIGNGVALYRMDYDEAFPFAVDPVWRCFPADYKKDGIDVFQSGTLAELLQPYSHSHEIFHCPSDTGPVPACLPQKPTLFASQGISYYLDDTFTRYHLTESNLTNPANHYYAGDYQQKWHTFPEADYYQLRGNVLFVDGHVRFSSPTNNIDWGSPDLDYLDNE